MNWKNETEAILQMYWTRSKRLIVVLVVFLFVIISLLYLTSVHYRSKEADLLHELQQRQEYLADIWSKCFHSNFSHKNEPSEKAVADHGSRYHHRGRGIENTAIGIKCREGYVARNGVCVPCPLGKFALEQWVVCTSLLSCNEMNYGIQIGSTLYKVGSWVLHAARWNNYDIIYALLLSSDEGTTFDFKSIQRLILHDSLLYPVGVCSREDKNELLFAWSNGILGRADQLDSLLLRKAECDNEIVRFKLAMDYVRVLVHLHSSGAGHNETQFVLCNSHSLSLLLSQFLIMDDMRLVLAALDNLPALNVGTTDHDQREAKIKCSQDELKGTFIAPEQQWPFKSSKVFNPTQQPGYNEKSDIWKIPDVTQALLSDSEGASQNIMDMLEVVHRKCKNLEPSLRPTAQQVLQEYQFVWKLLGKGPLD